VPILSLIPEVVQELGEELLGTFHVRQGDQRLLDETGRTPAAWVRVLGSKLEFERDHSVGDMTLSPRFDGETLGFQLGLDLFARRDDNGGTDRLGLVYGHAQAKGDVYGAVLGRFDVRAGELDVTANSLGAYATQIDRRGWYVDAVLMHNWFSAEGESFLNVQGKGEGRSLIGSVEGGYPLALTRRWQLEPQAQLVVERIKAEDAADRYAAIRYDGLTVFRARLGARLIGSYTIRGGDYQPFVEAHLWQTFGPTNSIRFNNDALVTDHDRSRAVFSLGLIANTHRKVDFYGRLNWSHNIDDVEYESFGGDLGVRIRW
jgi:outer membrane autotransporter protein